LSKAYKEKLESTNSSIQLVPAIKLPGLEADNHEGIAPKLRIYR